jgi:hypothetical protein
VGLPDREIADRAGVDLVSVGDSVGMNLWGRTDPDDMTLDEMILVCKAVRRGVSRALVSCDFPAGVLPQGPRARVAAARRVMGKAAPNMVKLDAPRNSPMAAAASSPRPASRSSRSMGIHAGQRGDSTASSTRSCWGGASRFRKRWRDASSTRALTSSARVRR